RKAGSHSCLRLRVHAPRSMVRTSSQQKCASVQLLMTHWDSSDSFSSPCSCSGSHSSLIGPCVGERTCVNRSRSHWASCSCSHHAIRFRCSTQLTRFQSLSTKRCRRKHCLIRLKRSSICHLAR